MKKLLNYINGQLQEPVSGNYLDNYDPSCGKAYSLIPDSDESDIEQAYQAASTAFAGWSKTPVTERARILNSISTLITGNLEMLARAESRDNGKPLSLARVMDIPRAASNFEFYAHAITQFASESHAMEEGFLNYTLRQPIGVVACISPWNLPLYLFSWKIAPAIAAGNCVVAKPSEITPMTAFLLSELCIKAGLPAGVLNIVHGTGPKAGQAMIKHPHIHAVSFTGGTKTGAEIARTAAPMFKKLSLELGGKNPAIVFDDCDFDETLKTVLRASFTNQGQICLCSSRILVQRGIYDKFKEAFVEKVKQMVPANPAHETSRMGAIVSEAHFHKILSYLEKAKAEGGKVLCGGQAVIPSDDLSGGWYITPAVIEGLSNSCSINQEEIFGPVVTLMPFETTEEAIELANGVSYGLAATVFTTTLHKAHNVAAALQSGIVWINCWLVRDLRTPFGGVKHSGVGREGGFEALRFFTEPKNVCIRL